MNQKDKINMISDTCKISLSILEGENIIYLIETVHNCT